MRGALLIAVVASAFAVARPAHAEGGLGTHTIVESGAIDWLQYGAAFTNEIVARSGAICPSHAATPCILGSGGGVGARVGYRKGDAYYAGVAYEFAKMSAANILNLPTLQQARFEFRDYRSRGDRLTPYVGGTLGVAAYGNTWGVDTYGPLAGLTVGAELEITRTVFVAVALDLRVIDFKTWHDDTGQVRDGIPALVGLEVMLESRTQLDKLRILTVLPEASLLHACAASGAVGENADGVTFCLDCGFRLTRPTPAIAKRPEAPPLRLTGEPPQTAQITCTTCQTRNDMGHRFCMACGATLPTSGTSQPVVAQAPAPFVPSSPPGPLQPLRVAEPAYEPRRVDAPVAPQAPAYQPPAYEPLAPKPTVRDGQAAIAAALIHPGALVGNQTVAIEPPKALGPTPCPRCGTPVDASAQFCKVCGLALRAKVAPPINDAAPLTQSLPSTTREAPVARAPRGAFDENLTVPGEIRAHLVPIEKDGSEGEPFALLDDVVDIGSREGQLIVPGDPYVSHRHARLERMHNGWTLTDLHSANGVFLKLRAPAAVTDGDLILLGQQVLRFEAVMDAEQGLRPATQHGIALFGTPTTARFARLSQRTVEGITRDVFHVHRLETTLGRETADIVFTDDPFLSRRHALLRRDAAGAFTLEDLGSSNGTFVSIRGSTTVTDGDTIRVGVHVYRLDLARAGRGAA